MVASRGIAALALSLVCAAAAAAPAQISHEWGSCERRLTGSACDDVLDVDFVWVYDGSQQSEQVDAIQRGLEIIRNATENEPDEHCRKRWKQRLCQTALPPCFLDNEARIEAPQRLCTSECDSIWDVCSRSFKRLKEQGKGRLVPDCDAEIGADSTANLYFSRNYLEQWRGESVFVDWDVTATHPETDETYTYPCWGKRDDDEEAYSGETYFWDDNYLDNDDFQTRCEDKGGQYVLNEGDAYQSAWPTCVFTDRASCERNGGLWEAVDQTAEGEVVFECYLPIIDGAYASDDPDADQRPRWGAPQVVIGEGTTEVSTGIWGLPLEMQLRCEASGSILVSHMSGVSEACDASCARNPTLDNYRDGLVDIMPNGKWLSFVQVGRHIVRLRVVGRGRVSSEEVILDFSVVNEDILPPTDSDEIYVRTTILMPVGDVLVFDTYSFRTALVQVLNADLSIGFTIPNVRVLELKTTGIELEIRTTTGNEAALRARLVDPLFVYPLAQAFFAAGLLNATDSCSAVALVRIDSGSLRTLHGLTTASSALDAKLVAALSGTLGVILLVAGAAIWRRMKRIRAREAELEVQEAVVESKAASLQAREQDLEKKVKQMEDQERELLSEKDKLDREKQALEKEAAEAEKQVESVEREELRELDPDAAQALEAEELAFHDELAQKSQHELDDVQEKFKGKVPEEDLVAGASRFREATTPVTAAERVSSLGLLGDGQRANDVDTLRGFREHLRSTEDGKEFNDFIDRLVAKGALREVADDPRDRIKQEYNDSLVHLQNSLVDRREQHRAKLAERRRQRIALVIDDAKNGQDLDEIGESGDAGSSVAEETLVAEALADVERDFEAERERMRKEAPSQEEYESALARLEEKKRADRAAKLKSLEQRRAKVRQRLEQTEAKMERERAAAEARQREIAGKVASVFNKIVSVEHKVTRLKEDHHTAQQQLQQELAAQRDRQRKKLLARKTRKADAKTKAKVTPDEAS